MSLLATLGLELDRALVPASGLGWLVDYGKLPLAPAPLGPYEVLGGALEGGLPGGGEPLAGDGFSDWMTERVDFTALLPLEAPLPPGALPPPSPPPPDLEAMASLLKKELEQMEDFFLEGPLLPPPSPPPPPARGDRKQKKRDQNKSAALRYRQRKRAEGEALEGECQGLEARNRELRERAESVEREIQYVKDLLIEVYKARSQRTRSS
ncbi:activating transcription factor 5 [Ictidomys tridecemlineatus]|uniref:cyclic AMP-dependent transcription factor ATF-5 n=1 Tax=Ictidomys tridecemlineatus TaxID=43179 RepID=UPI00038BE729|nr:cyclic AMP-dependent transcription factor ATF-5 [Ictidomys tridecemlineatus]KAG3256563.1 activating transcription factor 5 [Ictidomys tridecemlineatus]